MRTNSAGTALAKAVFLSAVTLSLAACSSIPGFSGKGDGPGISAPLLGLNTPVPAPALPGKRQADDIDCPHVEVLEGTSALRVGGEGNAGVRYQYSMGELARECTVSGSQLSIKVGVQGRVLIGPAGAPGTFSVPVRIVIRSEKDQKIVASKFYRVSATIPAGDTQTDFTLVAEPLTVPLLRPEADEDYTVLVGFDQSGGKATTPVRKRKRKR